MIAEAKFWDRNAAKYAKSKIGNIPAYEATLAATASYLNANDRVLEIGCGTGTTALKLAHNVARYTATDISGAMIEIGREKAAKAKVENVDFTVAPAPESRFDVGSFDKVLGFNILHLLQDFHGAVARAHDLLTPGGLFISKTPCLGQMSVFLRMLIPIMQFFGKAPYVGVLTGKEVEAVLRKAGFDIVESRTFDGGRNSQFIVARKL